MLGDTHTTITRRGFVKAAAAVLGAGHIAGCRSARGIADRYRALEQGSHLRKLQLEVEVEGDGVFLEGPAVDRDGRVYFTDIPSARILTWDPDARRLTVFREDSHKANGLLFDAEGRLLVCEGTTGRLTRLDPDGGDVEILADEYAGHPLEPVNDVTLDARGRAYFTSRPSGEVSERSGVYVNAVYRADPDGTIHQLLSEPDVDMPNGILVSSEDDVLYLIEAHGGAGRSRHIKAFDLSADGSISNERILIDFYPGRSGDGMCLDAEGNLYVAAGLHALRGSSETLDTRPGIHVISPAGDLLDYLETPFDTVTNCTFGGPDLRTLYITAGNQLLSARTTLPGHSRYRPNR